MFGPTPLSGSSCVLAAAVVLSLSAVAVPPAVPDAEKPLLDTVDPWGLPFSDQLSRFQSEFAAKPDAAFAMGVTHELIKVWPVKYWFRGQVVPAGAPALAVTERRVAAGATQAFQVAVLPRMGASEAAYTLRVEAPGAEVTVYREVFVRTSQAAMYPRFGSDRWPDPLVPATDVTVGGTDAGVFWVDVAVPKDAPAGVIECRATLSGPEGTASATLPLRVVPGLDLDPKAYPFIAWFQRKKLSDTQFRELCSLVLRHHVVPVDAVKGQWDPAHPEKFDELRAFLAGQGQHLFDVDSPSSKTFDSLYAHLKEKGWLESSVTYSNCDEPDAATFVKENVPFMRMVREKYPGLRVYLASDGHENMADGCDAWMTDLSASGYDPERQRALAKPELWHYYCHLPIHWQMRAPLVQAPNMQVDNPALEHRLALGMSHYYGAKTVFIWAGNHYTFGDDFWKTLTFSDKLSPFPYGGIHNGNGWVVYPSPDGTTTLPSLRLKVIRDGLQDLALMAAARRQIDAGRIAGVHAEELRNLLNPVPGVFVHPHYFDQRPEALLDRQQAILRVLGE